MPAKVEKVLILTYTKLPGHLKEIVQESYNFGNDRYINFWSELCEVTAINTQELENYYNEAKTEDEYEGTFEEFIKDYSLQIEKWLIDEKIDLTGVTKILIHVCW